MCDDPVGAGTRASLSAVATRLRAARREALDAAAVAETEWEYAGRTWSWPAGEELTYFRELAPTEEAVLDDAAADHGLEVVGVGTGRVAVTLPGPGTSSPSPPSPPSSLSGASSPSRSSEPESPSEPPPLIAKLARYGPSAEMGDGRPQNRRERRLWEAVADHPFLPVVAAADAGDWVVMPRATVPPPDDERADAFRRVREALAPHRERFHFDELKPENVGVHDGRYWVVDYGRPPGDPLFVDPPPTNGRDRPDRP